MSTRRRPFRVLRRLAREVEMRRARALSTPFPLESLFCDQRAVASAGCAEFVARSFYRLSDPRQVDAFPEAREMLP